jgi:sulfoxide reductase heme-binding subunit YedZ
MVLEDSSSRKGRFERWFQIAAHVGSLLPLGLLVWDFLGGRLTVNWVREITLRTGRYALLLLGLSLTCSPVARWLRFKLALRVRRPLGLYAFMYAALHLAAFVGLDYGFALDLVFDEIAQKPFIQVGLAAFAILLALAVTSTSWWMKRLGKNWKRLHRFVYLAAVFVVVHYALVVKADIRVPFVVAAVLVILFLARVPRPG